ncbi:hypothetical protein AVEN_45858-1 [Araneus ventricosus]|uniref:Uncharacterized protein n=1 Tax=Araneus ventricosus TaxID=182803 RepID=A0A4Y2JTL9_ARAVE|nr:hypothetical protein AVEN_45858-1 [Araneus ventricosus]
MFYLCPFRKGSSQGSDEPGRREVKRPVLPVDRQQPDSGKDAHPQCSGQQFLLPHYGIRRSSGQPIQVRFRSSALFEYTVRNGNPCVYSISETQDDPESGMFWFLFKSSSSEEGDLELITKSPADVVPSNKHHLIFWYKYGSWIR